MSTNFKKIFVLEYNWQSPAPERTAWATLEEAEEEALKFIRENRDRLYDIYSDGIHANTYGKEFDWKNATDRQILAELGELTAEDEDGLLYGEFFKVYSVHVGKPGNYEDHHLEDRTGDEIIEFTEDGPRIRYSGGKKI